MCYFYYSIEVISVNNKHKTNAWRSHWRVSSTSDNTSAPILTFLSSSTDETNSIVLFKHENTIARKVCSQDFLWSDIFHCLLNLQMISVRVGLEWRIDYVIDVIAKREFHYIRCRFFTCPVQHREFKSCLKFCLHQLLYKSTGEIHYLICWCMARVYNSWLEHFL
jgi:hypothetical protein